MPEAGDLGQYNEAERRASQDSVKYYRDLKNSIDTALEEGEARGEARGLAEGLAKGRAEGQLEEKPALARQLKRKGFADLDIAELTGLSEQAVAQLQETSP